MKYQLFLKCVKKYIILFKGNYTGWKATCIGNNSSAAVSMLKQEYKEGEMKLADALDLSIKVLSKTLVR